MTQIFINEIDFPQEPPKTIDDFMAKGDETAIFMPVLKIRLPIKKDLAHLFQDFYKKNKKEVENYCKKLSA